MKGFQNIGLCRIVLMLFILLLAISSCKNDTDESSGYQGKWKTERAIPSTYGYTKADYFLTISENKYNESFFILSSTMYGNLRFVSIDGSISISGTQIQFRPAKLSYYNCNNEKEKIEPPYNIVPYNFQDDGSHLTGLFYPISSYKAEFTFDGKTLNLQIDYDSDGDYSEYVETIVYTRQ